MKHIKALYGAAIVTSAFADGCSTEEIDAPEVGEVAEDPSLDEMYSETVVDLDRGGEIVSQKWISKREQIARRDKLAELEAQGLGQSEEAIVTEDSDCLGPLGLPVFAMWSNTNYTGFSICFVGDGIATLGSYCMIDDPIFGCASYWNGPKSFKVSSFETTAQFFTSQSNPCGFCPSRSTSTQVANATCEDNTNYLILDSSFICPP